MVPCTAAEQSKTSCSASCLVGSGSYLFFTTTQGILSAYFFRFNPAGDRRFFPFEKANLPFTPVMLRTEAGDGAMHNRTCASLVLDIPYITTAKSNDSQPATNLDYVLSLRYTSDAHGRC